MQKIAMLLLTFGAALNAQAPARNYSFSKDALIAFDKQLQAAMEPDLPENAYFPPFVKQRLKWIKGELAAGKLGRYTVGHSNGNLLMASGLLEVSPGIKIPVIYLFLTELAKSAIIETGGLKIDELLKNTYAVGHVHETIHLERSAAELEHARLTDIKEESRAWLKTAKLAIHPLIRAKHPLDPDMVRLDGIASACKYTQPCPRLADWLNRPSYR